MNNDAQYFIDNLKLCPHPEGGFYKQTCQSDETINFKRFDGDRLLWTSIYFLLRDGEISHFHRLKSDELWYFHGGSSLTVYVLKDDGVLEEHLLGLDIANGEEPQFLVPRGAIFASKMNKSGFSLVGCMVAPGFDFHDFELIYQNELLSKFPKLKKEILELALPNPQ